MSERMEKLNELKQEQKREQRMAPVQANAKSVKKSIGKRLAGALIEEDLKTVADYSFNDILIPWIKNVLIDLFEGAVEMIFTGERRSGGYGTGKYCMTSGGTKKDYTVYYKSESNKPVVRASSSGRYQIKDICVASRKEVDEIFSSMAEAIEEYGNVSVADLYQAVGVDQTEFTDYNWGWTSMSGCGTRHTRDGFLLILPKVESLK